MSCLPTLDIKGKTKRNNDSPFCIRFVLSISTLITIIICWGNTTSTYTTKIHLIKLQFRPPKEQHSPNPTSLKFQYIPHTHAYAHVYIHFSSKLIILTQISNSTHSKFFQKKSLKQYIYIYIYFYIFIFIFI